MSYGVCAISYISRDHKRQLLGHELVKTHNLFGKYTNNRQAWELIDCPIEESPYQIAHSRLTQSNELIGREEEQTFLQNFLSKAKQDGRGCLYMSGPTGAGKSLTARVVLEKTKTKYVMKNLSTSCKSNLLCEIAEMLCCQKVKKSDAMSVLTKHCRKNVLVVVIEEADEKGNADNMSSLCGLAQTTNLIVIAIGNNVNFQMSSSHWIRLQFRCYQAGELQEIVESKLGLPLIEHVFCVNVLKLWASRAAGIMGDYRAALAALIQAIDVAEENRTLVSLKDMQNGFTKMQSGSSNLLNALAPLSHTILKMFSEQQILCGEEWSFKTTDLSRMYRDRFKVQQMSESANQIVQTWDDIGALIYLSNERFRIKSDFL